MIRKTAFQRSQMPATDPAHSQELPHRRSEAGWLRGFGPRRVWVLVAVVLVVGLAALVVHRQASSERRQAARLLGRVVDSLAARSSDALLELMVVPQVVAGKSTAEQAQWLRDVLREEVTAEGVAALRSKGKFGRLPEVFPESSSRWTEDSGVRPEDCLAWRMERGGITAEVVYASSPQGFRFLRINNVAQMADPNLQ